MRFLNSAIVRVSFLGVATILLSVASARAEAISVQASGCTTEEWAKAKIVDSECRKVCMSTKATPAKCVLATESAINTHLAKLEYSLKGAQSAEDQAKFFNDVKMIQDLPTITNIANRYKSGACREYGKELESARETVRKLEEQQGKVNAALQCGSAGKGSTSSAN